MRKSKLLFFFAACLGMGLLILDSRTALEGARDGVALALTVLIPSLFPFLFLSIAITSSCQEFALPIFITIRYLFHLPPGTDTLLLTGFLGGYPAGAQAVYLAYSSKQISKENSEKLLGFCNNAGPSFLFGMAAACFSERWMIWALWLLHILGALAAAQMHPCAMDTTGFKDNTASLSVAGILQQTLTVISIICGWVVLFRVVIAFADRWFLWFLPAQVRVLFIGLLELSNGICELQSITNENIRFLTCSAMLSLGGLCVGLQTFSVTDGLSKRYYYRGKIIQLIVSICGGAVLMYHAYYFIPLILLPFLLKKKSVEIHQRLVYNKVARKRRQRHAVS